MAEKKETTAAEKKPAAKKNAPKEKNDKIPFLMYKGRPLVRSGNILYYGFMNEPYVAMFQIMSTTEKNGMTVADKVSFQIISTDPTIDISQRIIKTGEKVGLYNAMDFGSVWLERALAGKIN